MDRLRKGDRVRLLAPLLGGSPCGEDVGVVERQFGDDGLVFFRRPSSPDLCVCSRDEVAIVSRVEDGRRVTPKSQRDGTPKADQTLEIPKPDYDGAAVVAKRDPVDWLAQVLGDGPREIKVIRSRAKAAGVPWRTIRRVKDALGVVAYQSPNGVWWWVAKQRGGEG